MLNPATWVLIANDRGALICANRAGHSTPIQSFSNISECGEPMPHLRQAFACGLMLALCRGAETRAYHDLVIVADTPMMKELRLLQTSRISKCLIAEITCEPGDIARPETGDAETGS